jgi:hypothetical protein
VVSEQQEGKKQGVDGRIKKLEKKNLWRGSFNASLQDMAR